MRFQTDSITHYTIPSVYNNGKLQNYSTDITGDSFLFQDTIHSHTAPCCRRTDIKSPLFLLIRTHSTMSILQYPYLHPSLALPKLQQDSPNTDRYNSSFHPAPLRTSHFNSSQYDIRYPIRIAGTTSLRFRPRCERIKGKDVEETNGITS